MAVNSNVGFKLGTQIAVDNIIKNKTAVTVGSFYLTSDTHRLYIGESDGLHPVNEGVISVEKIENLPNVTGNEDAYAGRFYYIKEDNILCVFNGKIWAQINSDTYVKNHDFTMVKLDGENVVEIDGNIYNYTAGNISHTSNAPFQIEGANGIIASVSTSTRTVGQETITVHRITLTGDTYKLSTKANSGSAQIHLKSDNTDNDTLVEIVPDIHETEDETNVVLTVDETNGKIKLAVKDTKNKTFVGTNENEGFKLTLTDTYNKALSALLNPTVTYGVDETETVKFKSGNLTLDVYSKTEIQDKLKALNAMTYRGTIGKQGASNGTAGTHIAVSGTSPNFTYKVMNGTTEVKVSIGDTFMVVGEEAVTLNGSTYLSPGSLLIVRSQGNVEDTDGFVTSPVFDVVESTVDIDTTYHFEGVATGDVTNGGGILLRDERNTSIQGKFIVEGGSQTDGVAINITRDTAKLANGNGCQEKLTVKHGLVARTNEHKTGDNAIEMTPQSGNFDQAVTIPVIVGVTTDSTGHVTGVQTQDYVIEDTNAKMGKNVYDTSIYKKTDGTHVGVIKSTVGVKSHLGAANDLAGSMTINSQSLTITNQDGNGVTDGGAAVAGLQIEMIWGSFS